METFGKRVKNFDFFRNFQKKNSFANFSELPGGPLAWDTAFFHTYQVGVPCVGYTKILSKKNMISP